jgi:membrane protease YdiL (CAAX protease family)
VGLAGCVLWASRRKGAGDLGDDFGWRIRPVDLATGVLVAVAAQLFLGGVVAPLLEPLVGDPEVASRPVEDLVESAGGPRFVGLLLFVSVGAPIVEELFFRGLLLRSLQRRFPNDAVAVVLSSALFAVAHVQALPGGALTLVLVSLFLLAAALAVLSLRTGRLGPGIVTHAVFNAISLVTALQD